MISRFTHLFLYLSLLCCGMQAFSQDPVQPSDAEPQVDQPQVNQPQVDQRSQAILDLLAKINDMRNKILELDQRYEQTSGEEREAVSVQRHDQYGVLVNTLKEFNEMSAAYVSAGRDLSQLLQPFREDILATGSVIRSKIDAYRERLQKSDLEQGTLTSETLKSYSEDSNLIDVGYSLLHGYIDLVAKMDFDPALSRQYLEENLPGRLGYLASRITLSSERKKNYEQLLATNSEDLEIKNLLQLTNERLAKDTASMRQMIEIAEKIGIDTASFRTVLVRTTGQISAELFDSQVLKVLFDEWWLESKHNIRQNLFSVLFKTLVFFLILFLFFLLAIVLRYIVRRSVESSRFRVSMLLREMLVSWVSRGVIFIGILVALSQMGFSLGPLLAGLGVAGFIVGFALQDTLGNFASGMMILFYRPFDVGDVVEAGGAFGKVKSMSLVSTTILTFDNETLMIPNNKIWGDIIKNVTAQHVRRVDLEFGIGYSDSIEKAEALLLDIVTSHEKVLAEPEPIIKLHRLGESSVDFVVRPWCKTADYWDVYWDITRTVKLRFDAEGITIPFPQRDVHLFPTKPDDSIALKNQSPSSVE